MACREGIAPSSVYSKTGQAGTSCYQTSLWAAGCFEATMIWAVFRQLPLCEISQSPATAHRNM